MKATHLAICLRGAALQTYKEITQEERDDYKKLTEALSRRFSPAKNEDLAFAELRGRFQKPSESFAEFANALTSLATRAFPAATTAIREKMAMVTFLDGLADAELRKEAKRRKVDTLNQAVQTCLEIEAENRQDALRQLRRDTPAAVTVAAIGESEEVKKLNERIEALTSAASYWRDCAEKVEDSRTPQVSHVHTPSTDPAQEQLRLIKQLTDQVASLQVAQQELRREMEQNGQRQNNRRPPKPRLCFFCDEPGHVIMSCPKKKAAVEQEGRGRQAETEELNYNARR